MTTPAEDRGLRLALTAIGGAALGLLLFALVLIDGFDVSPHGGGLMLRVALGALLGSVAATLVGTAFLIRLRFLEIPNLRWAALLLAVSPTILIVRTCQRF